MIYQRSNHDCGVAAVANFCRCSYRTAFHAMWGSQVLTPADIRGASFVDMKRALQVLRPGSQVTLKAGYQWEKVPCRTIVSIRFQKQRTYHWVVKNRSGHYVCSVLGILPDLPIGSRSCHYVMVR